MLVNLFKSKTPIAILSLPLLVSVLASHIFFSKFEHASALFQWQEDLANHIVDLPWLNFTVTVLLVSLIAHQFNNFFNRHNFFSKGTFLPGFIYVLGLATFNHLYFSMDLLSHLFGVFALMYTFSLKRQEHAKATMFKAGLLFGLAAVASPFSIPFFIVAIIGLSLFRPFVGREWVLLLLGVLLPVVYLFSANFIYTGKYFLQVAGLEIGVADVEVSDLGMYVWIFYGLLFVYSVWKTLVVSSMEVVRFKKQTQLIMHMIWVTGLTTVLELIIHDQFVLLPLIPLTIILGIALLNSKNDLVVNIVVSFWFIISGINLFI